MMIMMKIASNLMGLSIVYLGAFFAIYMNLPLPWLLGPLLISIVLGFFHIPVQCDIRWRKCGQWIIGTSLGLYFTPLMIQTIYLNWLAIGVGIIWSLCLGTMMAGFQYRFNRIDWATAWFSSCIGGASEMVNIAERYKAQIDKVAAAHSLRIVLLVICVPIFLEFFYSVDLTKVTLSHHASNDALDIILLLAISLIGVYVAQTIRLLNPWVLGPIICIGGLTALNIELTKLPEIIIHFGQVCIGWSLGSKFPLQFFKSNRQFVMSCIGLNIIGLVISILIAMCISQFFNFDQATLILGISPGGIAEMALTAKALSLAVPVVVAFQLSRLIVVLITSDFLFKLMMPKKD